MKASKFASLFILMFCGFFSHSLVVNGQITNANPTAVAVEVDDITLTERGGQADVTLDGSGSSDTDGTIVSYSWTEGEEELSTQETEVVQLSSGEHTITLTVTDDLGGKGTADITFTVNEPVNANPTAVAVEVDDITLTERGGQADVTLDGSGSSDTDGTIVSYSWTEGEEELSTQETEVVQLSSGEHTITLTVTDDLGGKGTADITFTVNEPVNANPTAVAVEVDDITLTERGGQADVTLDGSGSSDTDGTIVSYSWTEGEEELSTQETEVVQLSSGEHTITLTVTDDLGGKGTADITFTVNEPVNANPTAVAVEVDDITLTERGGQADVTLDGSGSSDTDGTIVSYSWTEGEEELSTQETEVVQLSSGEHTITLTVTDDLGGKGTADITFTVNEPVNANPTAVAVEVDDITLTERGGQADVTLDGSGSSDTDGTIVSYSWTEGEEELSTQETEVVQLSSGEHTITLTVTDDLGGKGTADITFTVNEPVNANPTAVAVEVDDITLTERGGQADVTLDGSGSSDTDGTIVSYSWTEGEEELSTQETEVVQLSSGEHTITLTVTDDLGGKGTADITFTVNEPVNANPTAVAVEVDDITLTERGGQADVTLDGSGSSDTDGTIVSYSWTEGEEELSTQETEVVQLSSGEHTITLTVTDDLGGKGTADITFTVNEPVNANPTAVAVEVDDITLTERGGQADVTLDGSGSSDTDGTIVSYSWTEGEEELSTQETEVVQLSSGEHTITLTVTDDLGGKGTADITFTVNEPVNANPTAVAVEVDDITLTERGGQADVTLDGSGSSDTDGTIVSYSWTEGEEELSTQETEVVQLSSGEHTITLTVTDDLGGKGTADITFTVNEPVNANPTAVAVEVDDITLTERGGQADVTLDGSGSSDTDGTIVSYSWTEGEEELSTQETEVVKLSSGEHTITLTVTDDLGGKGTADITFTVNEPVNANPTAVAVEVDDITLTERGGQADVTLDGSGSSDTDGTIVSYSWTEGEEELSTQETEVVQLSSGEHTITLTVTDDLGGKGTADITFTVNEPVNANPTAVAVEVDDITLTERGGQADVTLDGSGSSDTDGTIVSYSWTEGEEELSTQETEVVQLSSGEHTITLTVTDDLGGKGTADITFTVNEPVNANPTAVAVEVDDITLTEGGGQADVTLDGSGSSDTDGTIVSYSWTEGEEELSTQETEVVQLSSGEHTITLTVTDDLGGKGTADITFTVNEPVNANPTAVAVEVDDITLTERGGQADVTLDGSGSSDTDGTIVSYSWTEGEEELSTQETEVVQLSSGEHTITLTVTDDLGGKGTADITVTVNEPVNAIPIADAGENQTIIDKDRNGKEQVDLDGSGSTDPDGTIENFRWSIASLSEEEPLTVTGQAPKVELETGTHTILLTVEDDLGATDTDELLVEVLAVENETPTAAAGADQEITLTEAGGQADVTLSGTASTDPEGGVLTYSWTEGATVLGAAAEITVPLSSGVHTITLTVTDDEGVSDEDVTEITVNEPANIAPTAAAGADQEITLTEAGGQAEVTLSGTASTDPEGGVLTYSWTEGATVLGAAAEITVPLSSGVHTITLTVTDDEGVSDEDVTEITINEPANIAPTAVAQEGSTLTDTDRDEQETVILDATASSDPDGTIQSYVWTEGGTEIANGAEAEVVLGIGTNTITLTVTDNDNATATDQVVFIINEAENLPPTAAAGQDQTITDANGNGSETLTLDGSGSADEDGNIVSYSWSESGTVIGTGVNPEVNLGTGSHTILLTVTDDDGATDTDEVIITINNPAFISVKAERNGSEDGTEGIFFITSTRALLVPLTFSFTTGGTATKGTDYTLSVQEVVLAAGQTSTRINVSVTDDPETEGDETVILTIEPPGGLVGALLDAESSSAEIIIADNEGCLTFTEQVQAASCPGAADGEIAINITGGSEQLDFSWSNGAKTKDLQGLPGGRYTLKLTDRVSGCSQSREIVVPATDEVPPLVKVRSVKLQLGANGQATLNPQDLDDGSSDNCGISKFSVNKTTFSCADTGRRQVNFTVEDESGNTASAPVTITIEDNFAPVFRTGQQLTIPENAPVGTSVGTVEASDNCQTLSFAITGGNEAGHFRVDNTGKIITREFLDYETNTGYSLTLSATAGGLTSTEEVEVIIGNIDDPGPDIGTLIPAYLTVNEDEPFSFKVPADAFEIPEPEVLEFSMEISPEWLNFNAATLVVSGTPSNEHVGTERITIRATDSQGRYAEQHFRLEVINTNDAPHAISLSRNLIQENQAEGTVVGHISYEDVDLGDQHTLSFVSGEGDTHNDNFTINNDDLLSTRPFDYEIDSVLNIRLAVTDQEGATFEQVFRIQVGNEVDGTAFLPNLFSPNGDQMNDYFILRSSHIETIHWKIYNREGRLLYETTDIEEATQNGWDGTAFGEPQPEGSYVWVLEGTYNDGSPLMIDNEIMGSVTLIR